MTNNRTEKLGQFMALPCTKIGSSQACKYTITAKATNWTGMNRNIAARVCKNTLLCGDDLQKEKSYFSVQTCTYLARAYKSGYLLAIQFLLRASKQKNPNIEHYHNTL